MGRAFMATTGMRMCQGTRTRAPVLAALRAHVQKSVFPPTPFPEAHFTAAHPHPSTAGLEPTASGGQGGHTSPSAAAAAASPQKHSEQTLSQITQKLKLGRLGTLLHFYTTLLYWSLFCFHPVTQKSTLD